MKRILSNVKIAASLLLLTTPGFPPADAAGIDQKGLAVDLSVVNASAQLNFDLAGFSVVNGMLTAFGTVTWVVDGQALAPSAFELPVEALAGSCDGIALDIAGLQSETAAGTLSFDQVNFDIYPGETTPNVVRNLLCTAARLGEDASSYAIASALNRILPAIQ